MNSQRLGQKRTNSAIAYWVALAEGPPKKRSLPSDVEAALDDMLRANDIYSGIDTTRETVAELATNAYTSLLIDEMRTDRFCDSPYLSMGFLLGMT
jgi:hypothetical protein